MKIEYDKYADAVYIEFSKGEFANNKILGIEIINVSKRLSKDFISNIIVSNI